jgi:hypothetical protein
MQHLCEEEKPNFLKLIYFFKLFCFTAFHGGEHFSSWHESSFFGESFRVGRIVKRSFTPFRNAVSTQSVHLSEESDTEKIEV